MKDTYILFLDERFHKNDILKNICKELNNNLGNKNIFLAFSNKENLNKYINDKSNFIKNCLYLKDDIEFSAKDLAELLREISSNFNDENSLNEYFYKYLDRLDAKTYLEDLLVPMKELYRRDDFDLFMDNYYDLTNNKHIGDYYYKLDYFDKVYNLMELGEYDRDFSLLKIDDFVEYINDKLISCGYDLNDYKVEKSDLLYDKNGAINDLSDFEYADGGLTHNYIITEIKEFLKKYDFNNKTKHFDVISDTYLKQVDDLKKIN